MFTATTGEHLVETAAEGQTLEAFLQELAETVEVTAPVTVNGVGWPTSCGVRVIV